MRLNKFFSSLINVAYWTMIFGTLLAFVMWMSMTMASLVSSANETTGAIEELNNNQAYMFETQGEQNKLQGKINLALVQAIKQADEISQKQIVEIKKKPEYEYLKSVTLFLFDIEKEGIDENGKKVTEGAIGTATIVAKKGDYYYILTNRHVCGEDSVGHCFVMTGEDMELRVPLELVKVSKIESVDLALWRTNHTLDGKRAINGLGDSVTFQEPVFSVGNYLGVPYIYNEGTVGGLEGNHLLLNLSCAPGCSGSGVFDKDGDLVAVIFALNKISIFDSDTAKSIAIHTSFIRLFLKDIL